MDFINSKYLNLALNVAFALVWFINGFICKILNVVSRHEKIVARILGDEYYSTVETKIIGGLEVLMFIWILSGIKSRWCAITQAIVIAAMNIIEFIIAPDLLLFGRMNIVFAACFILGILANEFLLKRNLQSQLN